jgi:NADH-quinone oxidoreductase subunit N
MSGLLAQISSQVNVLSEAEGPIASPEVSWMLLAPFIAPFVGAMLCMMVGALVPRRIAMGVGAWISTLTVAVSGVFVVIGWRGDAKAGVSTVGGAVAIDRFSLFAASLVLLAVLLVTWLQVGYLRREELSSPEPFALLLLAATGAVLMGAANDLIVLFVALEIMSLATYVMVAMHRRRASSQEAGIKYFILGGFASAVLLYGIAMVYGSTGSTRLLKITAFLATNFLAHNGMLLAGLALMLVGFAFKVGAVPFHLWTPDVYQGAPSPVTAFMASAIKVGAFAALIRVFVVGFGTYVDQWRPLVITLGVASVVVGAIAAISQTNVKRMLAFSSIGHAGFMLIGVALGSEAGTSAVMFYLGAYVLMAIGSFALVSVLGRRGDGGHRLADYAGLGKAQPGLAFAFAVFLFAQAGTPFTVGFLAKFEVIGAAVNQRFYWLAAIAMLSAVVSAFLYLRIIVAMYFQDVSEPWQRVAVPRLTAVVVGLCLFGTVVLGVMPRPLQLLTDDAHPELVAVSQTP